MTQEQISLFRQRLLELMEDIQRGDNTIIQSIQNSFHTCPDQIDRAAMESDRNMLIILGKREKTMLRQVTAALSMIHDGSYGICQTCGENIPFKRLDVQPTSTLCVDCQEVRENCPTFACLA